MKTADLTGALLDYWVAKAEGVPAFVDIGHCWQDSQGVEVYAPSIDWAHGGPLIEKYRMSTVHCGSDWFAGAGGRFLGNDPAPLVAVCRAVVRNTYGDEVPDGI